MASRRLDIGSLLCDDNQPTFSPLEVLVQAATEERKRLGVADDTQQHPQISPSDTRQYPVNDSSPSPHLSRYHVDDLYLPSHPLYLQRTSPHHDNRSYPQYHHHSPSSQHFDFSLEADRRRRLQEAGHQQRLQHKQHTQELEYQRQQEHERAYHVQELERRRREEDHLRALEYQRELDRRGAERLQQLLTEEKRQETERQRELEERRQSERHFEIERPRAVTEKHLSQQFVNEQRQYDSERRSFFDMPPHNSLSPVVAPTSIAHLISNSDPPRSTPSASPDSSANPLHHNLRPLKKPRYSVSPTRHDDLERITHDRDPKVVDELSYGRVDSLVASPCALRRPGSHNRPRKAPVVADILADKEPPRAQADHRDAHMPPSPASRRSPPGSQIGRVKAARKSDEYIASLRESSAPTAKGQVLPKSSKVAEDLKVKQEPRRNRIDEARQKNPASKMQTPNSKATQRDDPHEFFLHQYDEVPTPKKSTISAHLDPAAMPSTSSNPISPTPSANTPNSLPTPVVVTLDKEIEELFSMPTRAPALAAVKVEKQEESDDMDLAVDFAVTELVGNLENDDGDPGMGVDVEDELLSLVDDRPHITNTSRRPSAQQQSMNQNTGDIFHSSPSTLATVISSAVDTTSDRHSVHPPGTTDSTADHASAIPPKPSMMVIAPEKLIKETMIKVSNVKPSGTATIKPKAKTPAKFKKASTKANSTTAAGKATPPSAPKVTKGGKKSTESALGSRLSSIPSGTLVAEAEAAKSAREEEEEEEEEAEADNEDDKLYCLCKTKYDENRFMIACDKCDEWYHTSCVNMPDLDVDLVDQFFCPSCIQKHPQSNLRSTYKQRCLWGLRHRNPDSPNACHKAARGAFSKYCSDECGVRYMQTRVDNWTKKGGKMDMLWESVKNAEKREGIVVCALNSPSMDTEPNADGDPLKSKVVRPSQTKIERETERLKNLLGSIVKIREDIQRGMDIIVCRERLLQLASERAEQVGQCGWDQRLCCDDEEMTDIGAGMLESYQDARFGDTDMEVDGHEEQWWCPGKKVCDRHAGWQTIRYKDVCKEKELKEDALAKLNLRERDLRKRIDDIHDPDASNTRRSKINDSSTPLKSSSAKFINGHTKHMKGKKRKAC